MFKSVVTVAYDGDNWMSDDPTCSVKYSIITYSLPSVSSGRM